MQIIAQQTKSIMEECKLRARDAGLQFDDESLEYVVTNQDLIELGPKGMIPTMYDYWVQDLEVIKGKKEYTLYPYNPYETVINSRPALSFYNDNNPDWLNVMIFYHVLAHIDFMQHNHCFRHTWDDDFVGIALADKRLLNLLRMKHGRWVDYVIEFSRGVDNICGYYAELAQLHAPDNHSRGRLDFFFDVFLQKVHSLSTPAFLKELEHYNALRKDDPDQCDLEFMARIRNAYPEFDSHYEKYLHTHRPKPKDVLQYLMEFSPFINKDENLWMKSVIQVVRNTSLYFAPQRRTKILNEGWASYWHQKLFIMDDRIAGHEADFARVNALVTAVPKVGLNPYAIGVRLFEHLEERINKGQYGFEFEKIQNAYARRSYDKDTDQGLDFVFDVRTNACDFSFINNFVDQDFVDRYHLVIVGQRINQQRMTREYFIKSKKADDYKEMIISGLLHPPYIVVNEDKTNEQNLHLQHRFEGKQLVPEFIESVMIGLEYLWGGPVTLETKLVYPDGPRDIVYSVKDRTLNKDVQQNESPKES